MTQKNTGLQLTDFAIVGRMFSDYAAIFQLQDFESTIELSIIDVAGGVSSFCSEAHEKGWQVVSADPIYQLSPKELEARCMADLENVANQLPKIKDTYSWSVYKNIENFTTQRETAFRLFLKDFQEHPDRYNAGSLPSLSYANNQFAIALVSYFLFMYDKKLSYAFHKASIKELLRVSWQEVRIHPVVNLEGKTSPFLQQLMDDVDFADVSFELRAVDYEWVKNSNTTLIIKKKNPKN